MRNLAFAWEGNTVQKSGAIAALVTALVLLFALVAWEWYSHAGGGHAAPRPVQQIAEASAPPTPVPSPTSRPVLYLPRTKPSPSAAPTAAVEAIPAPRSAGTITVTPAPTATPYTGTAQPITDEPMVAATLAPHVAAVNPIAESPNAPPRILALSLSTPVAHGGQIVSGTVETSSNVASVEARIGGYSSNMQKVGVGKFTMSYRVPNLPFFLHRTYSVEIIARNTRGDAVRSFVPITIR